MSEFGHWRPKSVASAGHLDRSPRWARSTALKPGGFDHDPTHRHFRRRRDCRAAGRALAGHPAEPARGPVRAIAAPARWPAAPTRSAARSSWSIPKGETVTDADVLTGPSLIYFGYTFCPDVCPLDTARNAEAIDILEERGQMVTPVFISIDPERDTPEVVGDFAVNLHERMIGLTGSPEQVAAASKAYKTYYKAHAGRTTSTISSIIRPSPTWSCPGTALSSSSAATAAPRRWPTGSAVSWITQRVDFRRLTFAMRGLILRRAEGARQLRRRRHGRASVAGYRTGQVAASGR